MFLPYRTFIRLASEDGQTELLLDASSGYAIFRGEGFGCPSLKDTTLTFDTPDTTLKLVMELVEGKFNSLSMGLHKYCKQTYAWALEVNCRFTLIEELQDPRRYF